MFSEFSSENKEKDKHGNPKILSSNLLQYLGFPMFLVVLSVLTVSIGLIYIGQKRKWNNIVRKLLRRKSRGSVDVVIVE